MAGRSRQRATVSCITGAPFFKPMLSLILCLVVTLCAAWLGTRPVAGAWFEGLQAAGWVLAPGSLAGAWTLACLGQALAAWQAWRVAGRHAAPLLATWGIQLGIWTTWAWALLEWHRPGWALGLLTASWSLQLAMLVMARSKGGPVSLCLAPAFLWLSLLWIANLGWWRAHGGGLASIFG